MINKGEIIKLSVGIAQELTKLDCKVNEIVCYDNGNTIFDYTDEALIIHNNYYDTWLKRLTDVTDLFVDNTYTEETNSLLLELADDIATELTKLECRVEGVECYIKDKTENSFMFTKDAEKTFEFYYDDYSEKLYTLINIIDK